MATQHSSIDTGDYTLTRQEADCLRRSNSYKPYLYNIRSAESNDSSPNSDNEVNCNLSIYAPLWLDVFSKLAECF